MEMGRAVRVLVSSVLVLLVLCSDCEARDSDLSYVTCGSLVKLLNTKHHVRLHSHDVKYGSGRKHLFTPSPCYKPTGPNLGQCAPMVEASTHCLESEPGTTPAESFLVLDVEKLKPNELKCL